MITDHACLAPCRRPCSASSTLVVALGPCDPATFAVVSHWSVPSENGDNKSPLTTPALHASADDREVLMALCPSLRARRKPGSAVLIYSQVIVNHCSQMLETARPACALSHSHLLR
ncbi:hypothetical protein EXIGLDRAFT_454319 [Exidia glandulosa HHB12029]|uniref:Uncharacterized protein n=1 Tax=Exidia glandulosa HHB12029 TaxID=1314781 RepID=A0A165B2B2_EXIGL|nr:hypothetical protein EXIGLDRAFT_454319 [Exidia glandulosa HHB12029]